MRQLQEIMEGLFGQDISQVEITACHALLIKLDELCGLYGKWDSGKVTAEESIKVKNELRELLNDCDSATTKINEAKQMVKNGTGILFGMKKDIAGEWGFDRYGIKDNGEWWELQMRAGANVFGSSRYKILEANCMPKSYRFYATKKGGPDDYPWLSVDTRFVGTQAPTIPIKDYDVWKVIPTDVVMGAIPKQLKNFIIMGR